VEQPVEHRFEVKEAEFKRESWVENVYLATVTTVIATKLPRLITNTQVLRK
jgi:hypothetical protein